MATIEVRFPGRRYHATPWGHHVNEGLVEWPPSPWRLLRALLATGYTKLGWREGELSPLAVGLLEKLASVVPDYGLPPRVPVAHSRHYMPAPVKTTLVFDTWAQVDEDRLLVRWPIELDSDERNLLAALAERLSYLGRAESWTAARLLDGPDGPPLETRPCAEQACPGPGWEQVPVLAAEDAAAYAVWRTSQVARALADHPESPRPRKPTLGKLSERRAAAEAPFPKDLVGCLSVDTAWLQDQGWSQPPGSRRVLYWRRRDALEVGPPRAPVRPGTRPVKAVLLALATESRGRGAMPTVLRTLPQAARLHRALASLAKRRVGAATLSSLLGRAGDGGPAQSGHSHAHLLPVTLDPGGDQKLDHVLVWAPGGLDGAAQRLLHRLRRLRGVGPGDSTGALEDYLVAVVGEGRLADLARIGEPLQRRMSRVLGLGEHVRWRSATPFFAPRFVKAGGKNSLEGQVRAELAARSLPGLRRLELFSRDQLVQARFLHYARREGRRAPKMDVPFGLSLELECPIAPERRGPLCLGFGSHFGLGRFEAE